MNEKAMEIAKTYFGDDGEAYVDLAYDALMNMAVWVKNKYCNGPD